MSVSLPQHEVWSWLAIGQVRLPAGGCLWDIQQNHRTALEPKSITAPVFAGSKPAVCECLEISRIWMNLETFPSHAFANHIYSSIKVTIPQFETRRWSGLSETPQCPVVRGRSGADIHPPFCYVSCQRKADRFLMVSFNVVDRVHQPGDGMTFLALLTMKSG